MRIIHFDFTMFFVLACSAAYGQSAPAPQVGSSVTPATVNGSATAVPLGTAKPTLAAEQYRLSVVKWYMGFDSPLQIGNMTLSGMGDEAAADILTILSTSPPLTAAQTQTALDIVHKAFAVPRAIPEGAKRTPVAAMVLLQKLQATAVDQGVKERIATETNYLNAVPQVIPPITYSGPIGPPPPPGTIVVN